MKTLTSGSIKMANSISGGRGGVRDWQRWAPPAAVTWSLIYAVIVVYWAVSGRGFPYPPEIASDPLGPLLGRSGPALAWIVVIMVGFPAAVVGTAMKQGMRGRVLRPLLLTAGALLTGILLLLMTSLDLLVKFGYFPLAIVSLIQGAESGNTYLKGVTEWVTLHQGLCMLGGFLWLAATVCYARRSVDACPVCGRCDGPEGWRSPDRAARWGKIAVYVALVAPVYYALIRYVWALGYPMGMNLARFQSGQENGIWVFGALSHGNFMLVGALLMSGLVQRWGEVFPRWLIGLAGRRVPIALAVIPASLVSVLLIVGGIGIWFGLGQMIGNLVATGAGNIEVACAILFEVGPTLLFPVWGAALAIATLGYYYRRRGPCSVCGRGISLEAS